MNIISFGCWNLPFAMVVSNEVRRKHMRSNCTSHSRNTHEIAKLVVCPSQWLNHPNHVLITSNHKDLGSRHCLRGFLLWEFSPWSCCIPARPFQKQPLKLSNIEPGQPGMSSRLERLFNQNLAYLLWYPHSIPITCGILDNCQKTWSSAGSYNLPLIANDSSTSSYPSMVGRNRLENMANVHLGLVLGAWLLYTTRGFR